MKIAIIGGGGVRVPLLVNGLVHSDLPIDEIALFDTDPGRMTAIASLASRFAGAAPVRTHDSVGPAVENADYVFTSIRAGGIEQRAHDEQTALTYGVVGQETVGAAGFAMAMRNVPPMVAYAREIERRAPRAWIINFTNPVGIVTQAVTTATGARVIGVCDTPTALFEDVAHALGIPSVECRFDYFGLNHLGWLREVYYRGEPKLAELFNRPDALVAVYRAPLFDGERLRLLRLLPTEYVFYYERPRDAIANLRKVGRSRGATIASLNRALFRDLADATKDPVATYDAYLAARNAGYMQLESGAPTALAPSPSAELTGYDKIAVQTVRAIHFNSRAVIPLNVVNRGAIDGLCEDDIVEVPCEVGADGAQPLRAGTMPASVAPLVAQVKEYERLTVAAAGSGDRSRAIQALACNPLVSDATIARQLVDAMFPA